jgi:hypothetical protein
MAALGTPESSAITLFNAATALNLADYIRVKK